MMLVTALYRALQRPTVDKRYNLVDATWVPAWSKFLPHIDFKIEERATQSCDEHILEILCIFYETVARSIVQLN